MLHVYCNILSSHKSVETMGLKIEFRLKAEICHHSFSDIKWNTGLHHAKQIRTGIFGGVILYQQETNDNQD